MSKNRLNRLNRARIARQKFSTFLPAEQKNVFRIGIAGVVLAPLIALGKVNPELERWLSQGHLHGTIIATAVRLGIHLSSQVASNVATVMEAVSNGIFAAGAFGAVYSLLIAFLNRKTSKAGTPEAWFRVGRASERIMLIGTLVLTVSAAGRTLCAAQWR